MTDPDSWRYVDSASNPSDDASRGLLASKFSKDCRWLKGPKFLWEDGAMEQKNLEKYNYKPTQEIKKEISLEMKKAVVLVSMATAQSNEFDLESLKSISSWYRCKRAVVNCLYVKEKLKNKLNGISRKKFHSAEKLSEAERILIRAIQGKHFEKEINLLKNIEESKKTSSRDRKLVLSKKSALWRLDPILDSHGILRVGGRVKKSSLSLDLVHPVILPKKERLVDLIVQQFHKDCNHMGRGITHNSIRQNGFWIINGSSVVSQAIHGCVTCRKLRKPTEIQKMGDLPSDRMAEEPPFTYCGVDLFGPFQVKERRSLLKRYGVLFTCLSSRAVHLETVNSLETDAFINSLRRFMARRGPVKMLRSDRGTNLVGAFNELRKEEAIMNEEKIKDYLLHKGCNDLEFRFNVPHSSHMGGAWERQIRTVRNALEVVLKENSMHLDDELLRTLFCEVENIVNCRPLNTLNLSDSELPEPLTPSHIVTMKSQVLVPPPGNFQRPDLYLKRRWRRVQYLSNLFWSRWKLEFLHKMQERVKWTSPGRNVKKGDIVLLKEDGLPRNVWRMAKVISTSSGEDGYVRKVALKIATKELSKDGRRHHNLTILERPVHKIVLLVESAEDSS